MDRANRFLNAYNDVDNAIRIRFDMPDHIGFSEAVRRSAKKNSIIRKYESDLLSYGKLRNAIVHDSEGGVIIAVPSEEATANFERISKIVSTPPRVIDYPFIRKVQTINGEKKLSAVVKMMKRNGYSNIPVVDGGKIIGVLCDRHIVFGVASAIEDGVSIDEAFSKLDARSILQIEGIGKTYEILSKTHTLDKISDIFSANPKLSAVLVTEQGFNSSAPVAIFTKADLTKIGEVLESYEV